MKSIKVSALLLILVGLQLASGVTHAQEDACPAIVGSALEVVDEVCDGTGRNQACYGNITLLAEAREDAAEFTFSAPGDLVDVASVQTLTLSSYNEDAEEWGVSLMRLQANLPETLPGANLTFVLFGDVEIENAVEPAADTVVEDGDTEAVLSPFQAFFFRSGLSDAACSVAPDSGIEIQTPEGAGEVALTVNEVQITLASTLYLQAQAGGEMTVNVVEGQAMLEAFGVLVTAPAGTRVRVPLDNDLRASGPPNPPEPYDESRLQALPISLLPLPITVAAALTPEQIEAASAATDAASADGGLLISGEWQSTTTDETTCRVGGRDPTGETADLTLTFTFEENAIVFAQMTFNLVEPGVYVFEIGGGATDRLEIIAADRFTRVTTLPTGVDTSCSIVVDYQLLSPAEEG